MNWNFGDWVTSQAVSPRRYRSVLGVKGGRRFAKCPTSEETGFLLPRTMQPPSFQGVSLPYDKQLVIPSNPQVTTIPSARPAPEMWVCTSPRKSYHDRRRRSEVDTSAPRKETPRTKQRRRSSVPTMDTQAVWVKVPAEPEPQEPEEGDVTSSPSAGCVIQPPPALFLPWGLSDPIYPVPLTPTLKRRKDNTSTSPVSKILFPALKEITPKSESASIPSFETPQFEERETVQQQEEEEEEEEEESTGVVKDSLPPITQTPTSKQVLPATPEEPTDNEPLPGPSSLYSYLWIVALFMLALCVVVHHWNGKFTTDFLRLTALAIYGYTLYHSFFKKEQPAPLTESLSPMAQGLC